MAERTPLEDVVKRAFDANLRYWETVGRATTDYMQSLARIWADAPFVWTPGAFRKSGLSNATLKAGDDGHEPAILLEGPAGSEARAVVMVSNDLDREVEAPVVPSAFTGPGGGAADVRLRTDPETVKVPSGGRVPVTLAAKITEEMVEGATYRGEVDVPGLSHRGVPVVVRRREEGSGG